MLRIYNFFAGASHVAKMLTLIIMILMLYKIKYLSVDCVMLTMIRGRLIRFLCNEGDTVMMMMLMKTSILGKPSSAPRVQLEVLDNSAAEEVPALQVGS